MRLTCPHCHQSVGVPDAAAGQPTPCPLCGQTFTAPALVGSAIDSNPHPVAPAALPAMPSVRGPGTDSPRPPAPEPTRSVPAPAASAACCRLTFRKSIVPWLAPAALALVFVLTFFPWVGSYPNGTPVYTQSAWNAATGNFWVNPLGDSIDTIRHREDALLKQKSGSVLMMLYLLLLIIAVLLAIAERLVPWLGGTIPDVFRPAWPHRQVILAGLCAALFVLLAGVMTFGFGLEREASAAAEEANPPVQTVDSVKGPARQSEERIRLLRRDLELGSYALDRTFWLHLVVAAHVIALLGAAAALWIDRNPGRPDPRLELYC